MSETQEVDIGPLQQIPAGEGRNFRVLDRTIAVFHTNAGEVFATQPDCPHRGGPLADGLLGDATVVCPLHERTFDLRTGGEASAGCRLVTYPARLSPGRTIVLTIG